ncbi:hypothetical protein GIB67_038168 [Kingdonia uniflora]|uniref:Uncharacterized protein n=1 Tax=Kingdonia uniflora TaxID=39325 RepID=A0A7J7MEN0_9MAGN|nr:hypothetical protein GIB67_038168 [Kingdonia uniflora]
MAFSEGNYEEKEIMDEEEVEEMEVSLNVTEKTVVDNQETINQKELDVAREIEKNRLFCIMLILSRDSALNQLTSELVEFKEKAASGSRHEAELAEYRIKALNEEIYDMKCNIRALNEQLLKRDNDLDTAQTNLVVSEADFEKLSSSIVGKDRELRNSVQIRDSLIASLADNLAHARKNVIRVVQRKKETNERINQLYVQISESERELRVHEMKYQKDLKFELDKRDGKIVSGEGSREMKEFLRRKEELMENMRIDLTNSWQKSVDLTRQMSERIDQLAAELTESKARHLKDNKSVIVTHKAFKELVVHEQEKYDGETFHQRQLSALVEFFVEEIKFLQVE